MFSCEHKKLTVLSQESENTPEIQNKPVLFQKFRNNLKKFKFTWKYIIHFIVMLGLNKNLNCLHYEAGIKYVH